MRKIIIVFYLCLLPAAFVYAQPVADTVCRINLEKIFKVLDLKVKYEAVKYFYDIRNKKNSSITIQPQEEQYGVYGHYFEEITGYMLNIGEHKNSRYVRMDIEDFLKQLNYTPAKARQEYTSLIQSIKSEKEIYLNCIDAALVKSDSLEYMHTRFLTYSFLPPGCSLGSHPILSKKMNYLKLFKEFILIDNNKVLPESINAIFYLKCGSKISADIIE